MDFALIFNNMFENSTFRASIRGLLIPFVVVALIGSAFVAGALIVAAGSQDRLAEEAEARAVRNEIARLTQQIERIVLDYSYWDQAVENLVERFDPKWTADNFGSYLNDVHGIDVSYVLDPDNRVKYAYSPGAPGTVEPFIRFSGGLDVLVKLARQSNPDAPPVPTSGFLRDGNTLHIAAASALTNYETVGDRRVDRGTNWVLLFTVELNPRAIARMTSHVGLDDLAVVFSSAAPPPPHVAVKQANGHPAGYLTWRGSHPGRDMLWWSLPGLAIILVLLTGLGIVFVRRAVDTALRLESQTATAIAQRMRSETYLAVAGTMIVALDRDGRVTMANRKACDILGYGENEIMGIDWLETLVAPEHRDRQRRVSGAALAGNIESVREHETLIVTKGGERRLIAWYNNIVEDAQSGILGTLCSGQDITAKRQTEDALRQIQFRFQALLDHSPSAIFLKDTEGRFVFANKEFARRNRTRVEDVVGKTDYNFLDDKTAKRLEAIEREVMETRQTRQTEIAIVTLDGPRTIMSLKFPILDENGTLIGTGGIGTDITEHEQAKVAAQKLQADLAQVLRLGTVGEIASGLAHEINQPLTAVMNYAVGMLRRLRSGGVQPEDTIRVFEIIAEQARRAGDIVRRMRQFVRREGPGFNETNINRAIREAIDLVTADATALHVAIEFDLDESLPPILADAVQVQQAILNLARNALDAMTGETAAALPRRLTLRTRHTEAGMIEVTVADTGPGIPERIRSRVLDPFFSTRKGAMGMGLPICRTIVTAHGGTLWFTTGPDKGTSFHFTLPVAPRAAQEAEPATPEMSAGRTRVSR
jgi:PAS domain S-box-containing protein